MDNDWHKLRDAAAEKLTEAEYEAVAGSSYALGRLQTAEELPAQISAKAGEMFARGDDDKATFLRRLAKELADEAKRRRADYERQYPLQPRA